MRNTRDDQKKKFVSRSYINSRVDFRNPQSLIRKPETDFRNPEIRSPEIRPESSRSSDSDLDFVSCTSSRPPSSMDSHGSHFPYSSVSDRGNSPTASNYSVTSTKTFNLTSRGGGYDVTRSKSPARTVVGVYRHDSTDLFDPQQQVSCDVIVRFIIL